MRLLLDTCVWGGAQQELRHAGHDVLWTGDWTRDPDDQEILKFAHDEGRILVTLDKDFGERAIVFGEAHRGIIRRGRGRCRSCRSRSARRARG
ncbi:MAG: DUF5615 family PIN-like protein [Gammaproteobacteria bacterium]|nr:DUF5615 family PIN-like protein [Gammaproteobacteria bacterium]